MPQHWEISEWEATFPGLSHFHYRNIPITILVSIIYIYFWRRFISSPDDRRSRREPCRAPSKNWNITGICGIGIYRLGYCRIFSTFCRKFFLLLLLFFCPLKLALVLRAQVSFARNEATPPPFWNTKETEQIIKLQSLTGWNSEGKKISRKNLL